MTVAERAPTRPCRILLVEDEPANRALVRAIVARAGSDAFTLREAVTLAEAAEALATDTFDIVLLDVRLPDGTGLDLLPRLRAEGQASQPTIIVMSASVLPAQRADALDAGADGFIGKPYPARELLDALREARASRGLGE